MFSESITLTDRKTGFTDPFQIQESIPQELRKVKIKQLVLGMNRAADVMGGTLRRYSMSVVLHGRTGMLAKEWVLKRDTTDPLAWHFINRSPQAAILEFGGEVKPTKAQALAIPITGGPALTERGVPRYAGPREAEAAGHKLFVLKTGGKAYLAEDTGRGKLEFWYVLKPSVTIPAFRYATRAVDDSKNAAVKQVEDALRQE